MAGDWIRMRGELWTHPKFIAMSNMLIYGNEQHSVGFLTYVCGEDALGIGAIDQDRNENVTDRALRIVTKRALRDVTMCSLLRVWCAVNAHCKVDEMDAVCHPMSLSDLDDVAGFSGFGEAMAVAGWVEEGDNDSLIFRNFLEYNDPAVLRKPVLSNAERQRKFREKKRQEEAVTKSNASNDREEKRREEVLTKEKKEATDLSFPKDQKSKVEKSKRAPVKNLLPVDFVLTEEMSDYAVGKLGNAVDVPALFEQFCDHHRKNASAFADWLAAWRTWVQNATKFGAPAKKALNGPGAVQGAGVGSSKARFLAMAPRPSSGLLPGVPAAGEVINLQPGEVF
jgi:hypothetical protein